MDNNLVGRWVFPAIGAFAALYVYNTVFDNMEPPQSPDSVDNTGVNNEELKQVNKELLTDSSNVKHVDIVKKDVATDMSNSFLKESMVAIEKEDYEDVGHTAVNNISKTIGSKVKRWWY